LVSALLGGIVTTRRTKASEHNYQVSAQQFTDGFAPALGPCAALALTGAAAGRALHSRSRLPATASMPVPAVDATTS
jgi:hypothetical protein